MFTNIPSDLNCLYTTVTLVVSAFLVTWTSESPLLYGHITKGRDGRFWQFVGVLLPGYLRVASFGAMAVLLLLTYFDIRIGSSFWVIVSSGLFGTIIGLDWESVHGAETSN